MPARFDLTELAARESEQVEWKENVANVDDVAATLVAFANDLQNLGGGYVVCGARETRDEHGFQRLETVGLTASRLKKVENRVLAICRDRVSPPLAPLIDEVTLPDPARRVLVFTIAATGGAHTLRTAELGGRHYVRSGRETREARNGLLLDLLSQKGIMAPWDRRHPASATEDDLDLLALRDTLVRLQAWDTSRPIERLLSADQVLSAFVPPFLVLDPLTRVSRPRNFTLLLFGRAPQRFFPEAHIVLSIYPGVERSDPVSRRYELGGTAIHQASRAIEILEAEAHQVIDKTDLHHPNRWRYPIRALREAVVNAIVHRDYEQHLPIRVTIFADRIEIVSPGGLDRRVPVEDFQGGYAMPVWRNQALAWFFNRLDLAQAEGQGIPTMLRSMASNGNPAPVFRILAESLHCTLRAHPGTTAPLRADPQPA